MAPRVAVHRVKKPKTKWSMTVMMNARDLSRDDDFLSHLLVEHLGTEGNPLQVHKMDPSRRLPNHEPSEVLAIVKKYVVRKGGSSTPAHRVKRAVDALLELTAVKHYLHKRSSAQINAFATHASRYFELYLPTGSIEISHTSRYSHRTGKSELCILATTPLKVGQVISDLKGSLAHLTAEEDEELKRTDSRRGDGGIRRDFSVIHSNQKNKSHLFLGPARFVNHDCDHNVELFRDGRIITFRVIKPIAAGQEVTAHYGEGYFGKGNRHCLCETCEKLGRGGYQPEDADSDIEVGDDSSTDEETREERIKAGLGLNAKGNPNERRTRRGVYAILPEEDTDDEDRVGTTEVTASIPTCDQSEDGSLDRRAPSSGIPSSTSSFAVLSSSEGTSVNRQSERDPWASSLPDGKKSRDTTDEPSLNVSDSSTAPSSSHTPATSSADAPDASKSPAKPVTSRMTTRSSAMLQTKGKHNGGASNDGTALASEINGVSSPDRRNLRSTRSVNASEVATSQVKDPDQSSSTRVTRQTRFSAQSSKGTEGNSSTKDPSTGTPSVNCSRSVSLNGTPAGKQVRGHFRRCNTCFTEMPYRKDAKSPKKAANECARCKRHLAIFSAPWPKRIPVVEDFLSSSSDSSSVETSFEVVHEKPKGLARLGHKLKYGRKYTEVKHPSLGHAIKRRKTEPSSITSLDFGLDYPNGQTRKLSGKNKVSSTSIYSLAACNSTGGSSANREKLDNVQVNAAGTKRRWRDGVWEELSSGRASPLFYISPFRRTIRRFPSLPTFSVLCPTPALCARPSPNTFARHSWAVADTNVSTSESLMDADSEINEPPDAESKNPKPTPNIGLKRKRESLSFPSELKPKGKRFYLKDEKKPMPKGWVLLTDSSEETGEEEGDAAASIEESPIVKGGQSDKTADDLRDEASGDLQMRHDDTTILCQAPASSSPPASTPSLAYTPSSRDTNSPAQSSGTPDDHAGTGVGSECSVMRANEDLVPFIENCYPKRRKIDSDEAQMQALSEGNLDGLAGLDTMTSHEVNHDGMVRVLTAEPHMEVDVRAEELDPPSEEMKRDLGTLTMINASFQISPENVVKEEVSATAALSDSKSTISLGNYDPVSSCVEVPDAESKRALEVSNIIHGTAFSYGLPDARSTWKPKYHFSELDGWDS